MKGKSIFTKNEANQIRILIDDKCISTRSEQIRIRNKIRRIGFYWTDFSNKKGYTVDDFNELNDLGIIAIID